MKLWKIRMKIALWLLVIVAAVVAFKYLRYREFWFSPPNIIEFRGLHRLQERMISRVGFVSGEGNVFKLVEGDVSALERWLNGEYDRMLVRSDGTDVRFRIWLHEGEGLVKREASGELRLVDSWGHRLVYQCPHENPAYVCQLYSIGPNGIDEGGKGDDIDQPFPYKRISDWFEDPKFDGNVYKKFRGQFTEVTINGRGVIRHP